MTEFEQQVAGALGARYAQLLLPVVTAAQKLGAARDLEGITKYRAELDVACDALFDGLAPCVAAAIEAALNAADDQYEVHLIYDPCEAAALAAFAGGGAP